MASAKPLLGLDQRSKDGQKVDENKEESSSMVPLKKQQTFIPWTPAEEQRLKAMRDAGSSWGEIAKNFPNRSEGSIKKHWYKDMHYADFAEDDSASLLVAINEYEASKWKIIGQRIGKPAKACEQYAREHFTREDAPPEQGHYAERSARTKIQDGDKNSPEEKIKDEEDAMLAETPDDPEIKSIFDPQKIVTKETSAGYVLRDVLAVCNLAHTIWRRFQDTSNEFLAIQTVVFFLDHVLDDVANSFTGLESTMEGQDQLTKLLKGCRSILSDTEELIQEKEILATESTGLSPKNERSSRMLRWDSASVNELRDRMEFSTTCLQAFTGLPEGQSRFDARKIATNSTLIYEMRSTMTSNLRDTASTLRVIKPTPIPAKEIGTKSENSIEHSSRANTRILSDDSMNLIKAQVLQEFSSSTMSRAKLLLRWDLLGFMETQYPKNANVKLGSVITLNGTVLHCQATTCSEYAQKTWPSQGLEVLGLFQAAIDGDIHYAEVSFVDLNSEMELNLACSLTRLGNCTLNIESTSPRIMAEVFQQVIWMGAALRISEGARVQYSTFGLKTLDTPDYFPMPWFEVIFEKCELSNKEQSCWLPIFTNPVIARGFPVPEREYEVQGLEIPLEMMAALGGARHLTDFRGGLVLKGYSAIFVPIKRYYQSVQWHLIQRSEDKRILYEELGKAYLKRAMIAEVDYESLQNSRTFLGWWKSAEIRLGTADTAYSSIDWSPTGEAKRPTNFSGANVGFQTMITGQLSFSVGSKDRSLHFSQKGPFQRILQCAENTPVVLYDTKDHRAWLVPALNVILHILQTRHHLSPYKIHGKVIDLTPVNPSKVAAMETAVTNQERQLYEQDVSAEKLYYYKDAVLDIWSQMERLMEEDSNESGTGLALHGTMRSKVHGWEYMSLVHEKNYRRKEAMIAKTSGGWVDLINDIDSLVLFGTGFGEIIKPVGDLHNLCPLWRSLPKEKDYLAAYVPIMELLYSEAGSRLTHEYLSTSHLQWHRSSTLFEQCCMTSSGHCKCDRTQQIYHASLFKTFGRVRPPGNLEENGCVVFGQSRHPFERTKAITRRQNAIHILPNNSIQNGGTDQQSCKEDVGFQSPSSPASVSPGPKDVNKYAVRALKRPPSPLNSSYGPVREIDIASKRRRRPSYTQTSKMDRFLQAPAGEDRTSSSDDATLPVGYQSKPGKGENCNDQYSGYETAYASEAEIAPGRVGRSLHHKAGMRRLKPSS